MLVNLDCLDYNIANIRAVAEASGKNIRIASKSIRVPFLMQYIREKGGNRFFHSREHCHSGVSHHCFRWASYWGNGNILCEFPSKRNNRKTYKRRNHTSLQHRGGHRSGRRRSRDSSPGSAARAAGSAGRTRPSDRCGTPWRPDTAARQGRWASDQSWSGAESRAMTNAMGQAYTIDKGFPMTQSRGGMDG